MESSFCNYFPQRGPPFCQSLQLQPGFRRILISLKECNSRIIMIDCTQFSVYTVKFLKQSQFCEETIFFSLESYGKYIKPNFLIYQSWNGKLPVNLHFFRFPHLIQERKHRITISSRIFLTLKHKELAKCLNISM